MLKKLLTLILVMLFTLSGIITPDLADGAYAIAADDNPFAMSDIEREENLLASKADPAALTFLRNTPLSENKRELESAMAAAPGKQYIVKFKDNTSMQKVFEIVSAYTYEVLGKSEQRVFMIKLSDPLGFERKAADLIESVEEDQKVELKAIPSDEYYNDQWALPAIKAPAAWNITKGSNSVYVAVIDSGVNRSHPDLGANIKNGLDCVYGGPVIMDSGGHGTMVTGIIGAETNNNEGIAGVDWNVAIIPLQVADNYGDIYMSYVVSAIYDAADIGCDVINMSFGGSSSTAVSKAINYAVSKGCILVAAAGNDGKSSYSYPASNSGVISVGSVNSNLKRSSFSQYNNKLDVVAPGESILTSADWYYADGYDYVYADGTSFSAPHVAGIAALAVACDPGLTPAEFESLIKTTSTDLGSSGYDNYYGYGLVNAEKMLIYISAPTAPSGFQKVSESDKQVTLRWTMNSEIDLSGYQLEYKSTVSSTWTNVSVDKTTTTYTVSSLTNGAEYQFRIKAKDSLGNYSPYSDTITATPYAMAKIAGTVESTFAEGSENGKKITITLTNGTFIPNLDTSKIKLTGLPEGVAQGTVTRTGSTSLTISMSGNSTKDYDSDIAAQIAIAKEQVSTYKPADLSCSVTLKATVEPKPAKPVVTFSYDGSYAGQLRGINNTMEYSFDGGNTYTSAAAVNQVLTGEELYKINADKDIRVRVAATLRAVASDTTIIAIAPGPSIPAVSGNDIINMVFGMTALMEFTTDTDVNAWDWSWTKYATTPAPNNLPSLAGDKKLKVRIAGKVATMPSGVKLLEFTTNKPLSVSAAYSGLSGDEGKENGKLITVTLANGQYVSSINKDMFQLTGLPAGISKGDVKRTGDATVTIALLNNSTADYDTDYEVTVKIDKSQILPLQPDNIKTSVILPAYDDPVPAAPAVTFSYKTNPGKLMGSDTTMEYSLDGGLNYKTVSAKDMQLTAAQLASLDPAKDIRIRVKASLRAVTGEVKVLNIDPVPGLPQIDPSAADRNNNLTGIDSTMEFSIDKGKTWKIYNGSNLPSDLTGNLSVMVRIAATNSAPAGPAAAYNFTAINPALSISAGYVGTAPKQGQENGAIIEVTLTNGKYVSKLTSTEIKVSGLPKGISTGTPTIASQTTIRIPLKGNAAGYYDVGTVIAISVGKGQVLPAQPAALATTMRLLDTGKLAAPAGISFSFATDAKGVVTGTISGVNNTMEYSLDGGLKYTSVTAPTGTITLTSAQAAAITETNDIRVRFKADLVNKKSASDDSVIDIKKPAAPSVTNNDTANSISSIDTNMIFSIDGGKTWAKYTETDGKGNLPNLEGNLTVKVRLFAKGYNMASDPVTLNFTAASPALSISAASFSTVNDDPSPIIEGSEGSRYITVTLVNGRFANTVSSSTVKVTGLPAGVTVPAKNSIILVNSTKIKILLQGNSTEDYDVNKTVTITVDKGQLLPAPQPLSLTTTLTFTAVDESKPAAPVGADFSFNGPNANKLTGVNNTMEYSLDGGVKYTAVATASGSPNTALLSASQIAAITVDKNILVRYKAVPATKASASENLTIDIVKPDAPAVSCNDDTNTISGIDNTMEFSADNGKTWKVYGGSNLPADLSGNLTIKVRKFAAGHNTASDPVSLTFSAARPALAITAELIGAAPVPGAASYSGTIRVTLSGDTAQYGTIAAALVQKEILLTGLPTGIKQGTAARVDNKTINIPITGTNVAYYDTNKTVTVSIGKAQVKPAQTAALTTSLIFSGDKSPRPAAPAGIGFSIDTGKLTGVDKTMEFSLDGGKTYIAITATVVTLSSAQLSSITADNDVLVRYKAIATSKTPASMNYVVDITKPAAPNIVWSDQTNTITGGITSTMEFSIDSGKTWTACIDAKTGKNNVTAKDLTGNLSIQIRLKKGGTSVAGEAAMLNFTAINPTLTLSGAYSGTTEGQENGNTITVTLANGKFISSLKTSEVLVTGLPKGVTVAAKSGITRVSDTQIRILLSGNSTEDYDDQKTVTVTVGKSQLLPAPQTASVTADVNLPVTNEETSKAPVITFSFSGVNAGKLMGITTDMEYSIDGGAKYTPATANNVKMSSADLSAITAGNDILVRVKGTLRDPAGEAARFDILPGPGAPDVTADDKNDTVTDLGTGMEYSRNNGLTWTRFNGSNAPIVSGNAALLVRLCAANISVAGDITVLYFSKENPESSITAEYQGSAQDERHEDGKTITVTLADVEFVSDVNPNKVSLEGLPEGVSLGGIECTSSTALVMTLSGNSEEDYDEDLNVTVKIGKNQVKPSQKQDLVCSVTLPANIEADQYGLVIDFAQRNGFDNAKVKLFTADGATRTCYFSDNLDATVTEDQIIAYGLNQNGDISAIDSTNAAISVAPGALTVLSKKEATIDGTLYDFAENAIVFKYDGTAPGASNCVYDIGGIDYIRYNESVSSAASIYLNNGEISAILIPQTIIIPKPTGLSGKAPTTAGNDDGSITGVTDKMEYKLSTETDYSPITGSETTGLAAGTYYVRYAANGSDPAGPYAEVVVPEYVTADRYGLVTAFYQSGLEQPKVRLLTADGATSTYNISDPPDVEASAGQLVAYGLDQFGDIGAIATNGAVTIDSGFIISDAKTVTISGVSYNIPDNAPVFTYNGAIPGADTGSYDVTTIGSIALNEYMASPVSIYLDQSSVAALLVPVSSIKALPKSIALLQILETSYLDDSGATVYCGVENFDPATTSYAVTIYDPHIGTNEHISVLAIVAAGSDATVTQNNGVDLVDSSGTAIVVVTAEDGTTTNQYEVSFSVERRYVYVSESDGGCFFTEGFAPVSGASICLLGTDSSGTVTNGVLGFGTLTVKNGSDTLTLGEDYAVDPAEGLLILEQSYLNTLSDDTYTIEMSICANDGYIMTCSQDINVHTATPFINYWNANGLTLHVNEYHWDDSDPSSGILGASIAPGNIAHVGGSNGILISADIYDDTYRLKSLIVMEEIDGQTSSFDITDDVGIYDSTVYFVPSGNVTINPVTELVPATLPAIIGIELYKSYDFDTETYSDQISSTTTGISVNDTIYAKTLFNGAASNDTPVNFDWYELQNGGEFLVSPPFRLNLSDISEYVSDNYVKLTISGVNKYSTGEAVIEFYVSPDPGSDSTPPQITAGAVNRSSDTQATVKFTASEPGRYYYAIVGHNASAPAIDTSGAGTSCTTAETTISLTLNTGAKDIYISVKDAAGNISTPIKIAVLGYQAAPIGLAGVAPTSGAGNDGKITGTAGNMEYKLKYDVNGAFVSCGISNTSVAAPGVYLVRYKGGAEKYPSEAVEVTVNPYVPPIQTAILQNVSDATLNIGDPVSFNVIATGTSLKYYWFEITDGTHSYQLYDGGIYSGTTSSTLVISPSSISLNGNLYYALIGGANGTALSRRASLNFVIPLTPVSATVTEGQAVSFSAICPGIIYKYQWQVSADNGVGFYNKTNGGSYSGTGTATLTISPAALGMNGYRYRVVVSAGGKTVISNAAKLTVQSAQVAQSISIQLPAITGISLFSDSDLSNEIDTTSGSINAGDMVYVDIGFDISPDDLSCFNYEWEYLDSGIYQPIDNNTPYEIDLGQYPELEGKVVRLSVWGIDGCCTGEASVEFIVNPISPPDSSEGSDGGGGSDGGEVIPEK